MPTTSTFKIHPPPPSSGSAVVRSWSPAEEDDFNVPYGVTSDFNLAIEYSSKGDLRKGAGMRFNFVAETGETIPKNAIIEDAYLRLRADGGGDTDSLTNVSCVLLAKDGLWNPKDGVGRTFGERAGTGDYRVIVFDTGLTEKWDTDVTSIEGHIDMIHNSVESAISQTGQLMQENVEVSALGRVQIQFRRVGSNASAVVWIDVYAWNDDHIDEDLGIIATSDTVAFNSISTTSSLHSFDFSGANQINIPANAKRAFILNTDAVASSANHFEIAFGSSQYANGSCMHGGVAKALSPVLYPQNINLPMLYEADDSTIRTPPHGSIANIATFPSFTVDNTYYEVRPTDFNKLIQEWIEDAGYIEGDPVAVLLQPTSNSGTPMGERNWDDQELVVVWRKPTQVIIS